MRYRAVAHDKHAVTEADRLFERVRRQDDRQTLSGEGANELVDFLLGADVQASGRVVENKDSGLRVQPFGQNDLLLVAARKVEAERHGCRASESPAGRPRFGATRRSSFPSIRP